MRCCQRDEPPHHLRATQALDEIAGRDCSHAVAHHVDLRCPARSPQVKSFLQHLLPHCLHGNGAIVGRDVHGVHVLVPGFFQPFLERLHPPLRVVDPVDE